MTLTHSTYRRFYLLMIFYCLLPSQGFSKPYFSTPGTSKYLIGQQGLPLCLPVYYWRGYSFINFGDYLSIKLVERIVEEPIERYNKKNHYTQQKLLAIGSIISMAEEGDIIWGSGVSGKVLNLDSYHFKNLDVRAVRGPLTRKFLMDNFNIDCPAVYGDPALLIPYFFPEFKKSERPKYDYIIIPHYSEEFLFPKEKYPNAVYPTEPWDEVINKILDSKFVISSSLHGIVVAEAFGIPARLLKITFNERLFKYCDYYFGTNRPDFKYATSVQEALQMGGEKPFQCDLKKLYHAFPFDFWPNATLKKIKFKD
jgi:pyruvyltransferase